ncbi:putative cysteine peptidase containing WD40 repe at domain [Sulfurimonas gotlandica GD1]|uniref:Putative cysteine peptidase containing WD40 repe at domain n=1 Tax=Sulfurimonas gotlandica (strain DSM 19862 / JCM 16533 / GD1) TaxID=929558 RepID=B6BHL7_SULGG|nr:caspase family protein [Sulfurimonas gotlandica]EDZ63811.1 caspase domain protein [Sulfurimonas gotlandica GD1]EHP30015.1 putative cysteine peptidase containing WD40 repe at domain [Sulfurimonas gotlandica GD1]
MFKFLVSLVFVLSFMVGDVIADENQIGKPFVQSQHANSIIYSSFSKLHNIYITGAQDRSMKLWDANTLRLIKTLPINSNGDHIISSDGDWLITSNGYKGINLINLSTGKIINHKTKQIGDIRSIAMSKNNELIATCLWNYGNDRQDAIEIFDIKQEKVINVLDAKCPSDFQRNMIFKDNDHLLQFGQDAGIFTEITVSDGKKEIKEKKIGVGSFLGLSENLQYAFFDESNTISMYDLENNKFFKTFKFKGSIVAFRDLSCDLTNNIFAVLGYGKILFWDIRTEKLIKTLKVSKYTSTIKLIPDKDFFLIDEASIIKKYALKTFKEEKLQRTIETVPRYSFFINKKLVVKQNQESFELWNLDEGKRISYVKNKSDGLELSPDKKQLMTHSKNDIILWDLEGKNKILPLNVEGEIKEISYTKGKSNVLTLVSRTRKNHKYILTSWDIKKSKVLQKKILNYVRLYSDSIAMETQRQPEGTDIKIYNTSNNFKEKIIHINNQEFLKSVSQDSKKLLIYGDNSILIDLESNQTQKLSFSPSLYDGKTFGIKRATHVFLNHDNTIIALTSDGNVEIYDVKNNNFIHKINVSDTQISHVSFSDDDKKIIALKRGAVKVFDIASEKELLSLTSFDDGEWISMTPEGYFNASPNAAKHLNILIGPMKVSSIDQYYETFFRPDIVASVMSEDKNIQYATAKPTLKLSEVKPAPEVAIIDTKKSIDSEELQVTLKITPSSGGIGQIRLYLDGVLVKTDGDRGLQKKQDKNVVLKTYTLKLPKGEHTVKAIVYNEENTMASREDILAVVSTFNPITKPNIYAVVVGINEYKNPSISLKYAVADAELFAQTIKDKTKGLYSNVKVELLTSKDQTSKENITKTLKALENISPNDLFIFFVASHGMVEDAKYHMITSNVGALSSRGIEKEAISQNALRDMIANIPTTKKFIVLDTCNSGALGQAIEVALLTRGLNETTAMKVLSRAVGSTIISASSSSQEALEGYKGHGLLTYVLAEGLKGNADSDRDGYIKTLEIANFVEDTVPEIAEKEFKRAQYPFVSPLGQGFPLVKVK